MKAMIGKMRATVGYANMPGGPVVNKGDVVVVVRATNMPPESMIDVFVARVDNPGYSIGVTWGEVDTIVDCNVCDICGNLSERNICPDCEG